MGAGPVLNETEYWAGRTASKEQLEEWARIFQRDGCLLIENYLPPAMVEELRDDLIKVVEHRRDPLAIHVRMFETSRANLDLFDLEPLVSLAELLLGPDCHVICNNAFRAAAGVAIDEWHQDDPPHMIVLEGEPPTNIVLPPLVMTCNFYLTDVSPEEADGTHVIPGSHMFGAAPPESLEGTEWEPLIRTNPAPAGTVHIHNCQLWHRGGPNPGRPRYMTGITYARRLIGHKYYPFMNYQLPPHLLEGADERRRRLLGFLPTGAYG
ncbi:MAG TPA: phytanoyl-CoA dioxygenase family protein [Acidimicrobiales bacterium]|nr:phytanoyl-CoA dioxygenase family protein [Acidimicrobiales bacterium]